MRSGSTEGANAHPSVRAEQPRSARSARKRRFAPRAQVAIGIVTVCTGALFGISADQARSQPTTLGLDLPQLVRQRQDELHVQEQQIQTVQEQVNDLLGTVTTADNSTVDVPLLLQTITGPGIRVTLNDAPPDTVVDDRVNVNDLVVHQQDVDAVTNALWAGGAEAMAIQGVRISPSTPVRCIGNVILVGSTAFAPPYQIEAIGDPVTLTAAVEADQQIQIYLQYVSAYGMGWSIQTLTDTTFPPIDEGFSLNYATKTEE